MKTVFAPLVIRCLLGMFLFAPPTTANNRYLMPYQELKIVQNAGIIIYPNPSGSTSPAISMQYQRPSSLPPQIKGDSGHLTSDQKQTILRLHNSYRSNATPPAADMPYLVWDEELADEAELWVENCTLDALSPTQSGYNHFLSSNSTDEDSTTSWHSEKDNYDYFNNMCKSEQDCQHYTQLMFAGASSIGCGRKKCGRMYLLACHYNDKYRLNTSDVPYEAGTPCSKCPEEKSKCYMNLCVSPEICSSEKNICEEANCTLTCLNCGKLDREKCECQCADGWDGADCSVPCMDEDVKCGAKNDSTGYFPYMCKKSEYRDSLQKKCRKMCKLCNVSQIPPVVSSGLTREEERTMLDLHNLYRSNITPPAADMLYLVWDEELASSADEWADYCVFEHFDPKGIKSLKYGQNIAKGQDLTPEGTLFLWNTEFEDYNYASKMCKQEKLCTSYEQLSLSRASRVGCGRNLCGDEYFYACHYDQILSNKEYPYKSGIPCSLCPEKGSKCYMNMCISPELCAMDPQLCEKITCNLECRNCGKPDTEKCKCQCSNGSDSADFARSVKPTSTPKPIVIGNSSDDTNTTDNLCCGGKICKKGYVLNKDCDCTLFLSPSRIKKPIVNDTSSENTTCNLECQNCGKLDLERCECQCASGWDGVNCSVPCANEHEKCDPKDDSLGYFPHMCNITALKKFMALNCRKMCKLCNDTNITDNLCCGGKMCPKGYVLNKDCNCNIFGLTSIEQPMVNGPPLGMLSLESAEQISSHAYSVRLTSEEKQKMLDLHNLYRSNVTPPAANMQYLVWDDELAHMADLWADYCVFQNFIPKGRITLKYGQMFARGLGLTAEGTLSLWYRENEYKTNPSNTCKPKKRCGLYEQIFSARVSRVGCGRNLCGQVYFYTCYYNQIMNSNNELYKSGIPCNLCPEKGSKCYMNMCISPELCASDPRICGEAKCNLICRNCAKLDVDKCECQCTNGWEGADCSVPCRDENELCDPKDYSIGYYPHMCNNPEFKSFLAQQCRKMCKLCTGIDRPNNLCCGGKMCNRGYILNKDCECQLFSLTDIDNPFINGKSPGK